MYSWDRHDRLSVIGGLSLAPHRCRLGLYFEMCDQNITAEALKAFLLSIRRQLRRDLVVVMDRWSVHRKAARDLAEDGRFEFEWLPPYAPDLNPVEHLWSHTKYSDLANYIPDDLIDLEVEAQGSLDETRGRPELLRSFFHGAKLEL
jgi:transposase